tara:strand:- start:3593 stop:3829 length:237 start_codon:yes stop_codon:yes gene_type:complete
MTVHVKLYPVGSTQTYLDFDTALTEAETYVMLDSSRHAILTREDHTKARLDMTYAEEFVDDSGRTSWIDCSATVTELD